jgi:hypothetical protein
MAPGTSRVAPGFSLKFSSDTNWCKKIIHSEIFHYSHVSFAMEDTSKAQKSTPCHFWDHSVGTAKNSKCQGDATVFVRKKYDGRLCPLCASCHETFENAQKLMNENIRESIPGHGEFATVALSDEAVAEFLAQAPKPSHPQG